jgi:predicted CDP-diglyceride synthetase/phosphatidate cytidylyltransferase
MALDDGPTKGQSAEKVKAAESNVRKVLVRTISGGLFVILFNVVIWAGHLYTVFFVFLLQCGCFREMVSVEYNKY